MNQEKPYLKTIIAVVSILLVALAVGGFYYYKYYDKQDLQNKSQILSDQELNTQLQELEKLRKEQGIELLTQEQIDEQLKELEDLRKKSKLTP